MLCGVVLLLLAPRSLSSGLKGAASMEELPQPPGVGSCVLIDNSDAQGSAEPLQVVSCSEPHDGEVTMTWPAFVRPSGDTAAPPQRANWTAMGSSNRFTYFLCDGWNSDYLGIPLSFKGFLETSPPVFAGGPVYASTDKQYNRFSWSACVIRPALTAERYVGSIRGAGDHLSRARPSVFMPCLTVGRFAETEMVFADCSTQHRVEVIGVDRDPKSAVPDDEALAACRELVSTVTGAADPTFGGRLQIKVGSVGARTMTAAQVVDPDPVHAQDCMVELTIDGMLVGSVIGIGTAQLAVVS